MAEPVFETITLKVENIGNVSLSAKFSAKGPGVTENITWAVRDSNFKNYRNSSSPMPTFSLPKGKYEAVATVVSPDRMSSGYNTDIPNSIERKVSFEILPRKTVEKSVIVNGGFLKLEIDGIDKELGKGKIKWTVSRGFYTFESGNERSVYYQKSPKILLFSESNYVATAEYQGSGINLKVRDKKYAGSPETIARVKIEPGQTETVFFDAGISKFRINARLNNGNYFRKIVIEDVNYNLYVQLIDTTGTVARGDVDSGSSEITYLNRGFATEFAVKPGRYMAVVSRAIASNKPGPPGSKANPYVRLLERGPLVLKPGEKTEITVRITEDIF